MSAIGVVVQLTHTICRQNFVIQIPHQLAKPEIFVFLYFHQHAINFCSVMLFFFLLLYLSYFKFESQKCMNKPFSSNSVSTSRLVLCFAVFFNQTLKNTPQYLTIATYVFLSCSLSYVPWLRIYVLFVSLCNVFLTCCSHCWAAFF